MLKTVLSLSLIAVGISSAFADGNQIITACSGKDSKGDAISLTLLHDQTASQYSSSNPASTMVELQTPTGPLHYTVYDNDSETGDASIDMKSDDNGGIQIHSEGGGLMTSGTIGFLQSKFNFIDCQAGPAAPLPWQ
jgi:hypothetical protein